MKPQAKKSPPAAKAARPLKASNPSKSSKSKNTSKVSKTSASKKTANVSKVQTKLLAEYRRRYDTLLKRVAERITEQLKGYVTGTPNIDRFMARAKSPDRFLAKAMKQNSSGKLKYENPFDQIQDLIGARIVVFYRQDVEVVDQIIELYYTNIERRDLIPESESEFGYFGKHYVLKLPEDVIMDDENYDEVPKFFELQIKTLFQHAWSEASHDLAYKPGKPLTSSQKRKVAFTAAQSWGADQIFAELHSELNGFELPE